MLIKNWGLILAAKPKYAPPVSSSLDGTQRCGLEEQRAKWKTPP